MKRNKDSSPPPERKEREKKVKTSDQTSARSVADPDSTPGSTADLSVDSERRLLTNRSPSSSSAEFKSMVETSTSLIDHGLVRAAAMATDTLSLADNSNHNTNTNVTAATDIDNQATSDRKLDSDEDNIEYGEHRHSDMHALQRMYTDEEDEDSDEMMDEMQRQMMNMMEPPTPVWSLRCGRCHATICPTAMVCMHAYYTVLK